MSTTTTGAFVSIDLLDVPEEFERTASKVDDDILRRSVEASERAGQGGIQQPLAVLEKPDGRYVVARGTRRIRVARSLGIAKVPIAIFETPEGETPEEYAPRLRLILEIRQDLMPSQKAELIAQIKAQFKKTNLALSHELGVDQDTLTNWLSVRNYVPEVVEAMDAGLLTMQAARVFDGMSEKGQRAVWKAHGKELTKEGAGRLHKTFRAQYPPTEYPTYYKDPEKAHRRIKGTKPGVKRQVKPRASYTSDEKRKLLRSYEFKAAELESDKEELESIKAKIAAATPIISALIRNKRLWALVPEEMRPEIERFAEVYL